MRLVCPNCEAKYEVPEDAIPETGRDVQCANCGHAWYQMRPRAVVTETVQAAAPVALPPVPEPEPPPELVCELVPEPKVTPEVAGVLESEPLPELVPEPVPVPEVTPGVAGLSEPEPEPEPKPEVADAVAEAGNADADLPTADAVATVGEAVEEVAEDTLASAADTAEAIETAVKDEEPQSGSSADALSDVMDPAPEPAVTVPDATVFPETEEADEDAPLGAAGAVPAAYAVDDSVLAILREEAEREASARRAEAAKPLEMQTDLEIEAAMPAARKPVEIVGPAPSSSGLVDKDADEGLSARRTRLPDVEEINSTLRPGEQTMEEAAAEAMQGPVEARSSFRKGFLMVMTFAILGAALYISADALASAVPALAGFLDAYVGFVDSLRLQLDGLMQSATVAINGA